MTATLVSRHNYYMTNSPSYAGYHARFGKLLTFDQAQAVACDHGVNLDQLAEEGLEASPNGFYFLLELMETLGY